MPEKPFEIMETNEELRRAFLKEHGGRLPDNFIEAAMGGSVDGPPNPEAERADLAISKSLDAQLRDLTGGVTQRPIALRRAR